MKHASGCGNHQGVYNCRRLTCNEISNLGWGWGDEQFAWAQEAALVTENLVQETELHPFSGHACPWKRLALCHLLPSL